VEATSSRAPSGGPSDSSTRHPQGAVDGRGDEARDKDGSELEAKAEASVFQRGPRKRKRQRTESPPPQRQLRARQAPGAVLHESELTMYVVGGGFRSSIPHSLERMVAQLHSQPEWRRMCEEIQANAELYLSPRRSQLGWGYVSDKHIPEGTCVGYYSGTLVRAQRRMSNHCIKGCLTIA
jgi:hypothetical protein